MRELKIGDKKQKSIVVTEEQLADHVGSGSVAVFATPMVVALMEGAAAALAQEGLEDIYTTVGTQIAIKHTAATAAGVQVTAEAELTAVEGRCYRFAVRAWDNAGEIASGTHERVSVKAESFAAKAAARGAQAR